MMVRMRVCTVCTIYLRYMGGVYPTLPQRCALSLVPAPKEGARGTDGNSSASAGKNLEDKNNIRITDFEGMSKMLYLCGQKQGITNKD